MAAAAKPKNKIKNRRTGFSIKRFLFTVFMLMAVLTALLFLINKYFFKITNILIITDDKYSYEEVLKASGIKEGQELLGLDVKKIKENIKDSLTYAESVNISRIPPFTVRIEVKSEKGFFGIMLGGDYYIISRNFRVVDKIKVVGNIPAGIEFTPPDGIITIETDEIKKCYMGDKIEFKDADIYDFFKDITELADENMDMVAAINSIDIKNKFKVYMNYGDRLLLRLGVFENISSKILNSFEIINSLPDYAKGIIDMTNEKTASFRYEENVLKLYKNEKNK